MATKSSKPNAGSFYDCIVYGGTATELAFAYSLVAVWSIDPCRNRYCFRAVVHSAFNHTPTCDWSPGRYSWNICYHPTCIETHCGGRDGRHTKYLVDNLDFLTPFLHRIN